MDSHQPSLPQGIKPGALAARPPRTWKLGQWAAQAALAFLPCAGGFLSLLPWGRALTRSTLLLPTLLSASAPAPLVLVGYSMRFRRLTLSSASGPVFLDIYEPTTPPPPIPGGREAIIDVPGAGDNRAVPQLVTCCNRLRARALSSSMSGRLRSLTTRSRRGMARLWCRPSSSWSIGQA